MFFFAFLCGVCILLVFLRSLVFLVVSVLCFACFPFFRLSSFLFPVFRCFSLFFASSFLFIRFKRFECFLDISRQLLSIVPQSSATGKLQKPEKKKGISLRPRLHGLCQKLSKRCSFSRLRPNEESSGLTNDTREDPIMESHRPIANKNSPKIF